MQGGEGFLNFQFIFLFCSDRFYGIREQFAGGLDAYPGKGVVSTCTTDDPKPENSFILKWRTEAVHESMVFHMTGGRL